MMIMLGSHVSALPTESEVTFVSTPLLESSGDFSRFPHNNPMHARMSCLTCHRHGRNPSQVKRPSHTPCAGCHSLQFADTNSPICTICHTNVNSGTVKPLSSLKGFGVKFDHARHTKGAARPRAGCITCHKIIGSGAARSIPMGANAHATCFQCHVPLAQYGRRNISSCGVCHQPGRYARPTQWSNAFNVSFSHAKHDSNKGLNCSDCHSIKNTGRRTKQVTKPVPLNHHAPNGVQSCQTCHNGKRAFGGDDFSTCKRCHQGTTWHF